LKPEWWGSPLVQEEKYQEKPVEREEIIIIIITIIITSIRFVILLQIIADCRPDDGGRNLL
jgi:hypothetical protein